MSETNEGFSSGPEKGETIIEVDIQRLREFKNHPFKVIDDAPMRELIESIRTYGILNPLIVRPHMDGIYEIISGHRRKHAAQLLGYRKVPVIIRILKDEDSIISMVDSNLQREKLLPSEKAFAYKMKNDAIKRKFAPPSRFNGGQIDYRVKKLKTVEQLGILGGDSSRQVGRYIRLTFLIPELLDLVDEEKIGFNPAVNLSFLNENEQREFLDAVRFTQSYPSVSQSLRIKELSKEGNLTYVDMRKILSEIKKGEINRVTFKNEQLYQYFPKTYSVEQIKEEIIELLEKNSKKRKGGKGRCAE